MEYYVIVYNKIIQSNFISEYIFVNSYDFRAIKMQLPVKTLLHSNPDDMFSIRQCSIVESVKL